MRIYTTLRVPLSQPIMHRAILALLLLVNLGASQVPQPNLTANEALITPLNYTSLRAQLLHNAYGLSSYWHCGTYCEWPVQTGSGA